MNLELEADIKIWPTRRVPREEYRYFINKYHCPRWLEVDNDADQKEVQAHLSGYKQVVTDVFTGTWHYRLVKPDWQTFREWLRVEYNELESHTPYQSPEERAYQSIISWLIEYSSYDDVKAAVYAEMYEERITDREYKLYEQFEHRLTSFISHSETGY